MIEKEATDRDDMTELMERLHNDPSIEVALVDSPGSLKAAGLVPLFVNSDIIVIPFHYDLVTRIAEDDAPGVKRGRGI